MRNSLLALTLILTACSVESGSGTAATETRELADIEAVSLSNFLSADVRVGEDLHSIEITCDDNLLEFIETEVVSGELRIKTKPGVNIRTKLDCTAIVKVGALHTVSVSGSGDLNVVTGVVRDLESISVSGSGAVTMEEAEACDLDLSVSGSGSVGIDQLTACDVEASVSGSGEMRIVGTATSIDASISGSGSIDAGDLPVNDVKAAVSGSGDAVLHALETADISISGSGDVTLRGPAEDVQVSEIGSGSVTRE